MQKIFAIIFMCAIICPAYSLSIMKNLKGTKISSVYVQKDQLCNHISLNTRTLEYLLTKRLKEYDIYDTTSNGIKPKNLYVTIRCLSVENTDLVAFSIDVDICNSLNNNDKLPEETYYSANDFGCASKNRLDEGVEQTINFDIKMLIDYWVHCNTSK